MSGPGATPQAGRPLATLVGEDLGAHEARFDDRDTILYALAVGTPAARLDLLYEKHLQALPAMACGLGLWAVEAAGRLGAYDPHRSLHAAQSLTVHRPFPATGAVAMHATVAHVWDKGRASVVEIEVVGDVFTAGYTIFLPGTGGWGGERGPSTPPASEAALEVVEVTQTSREQALLYRLTGDRHPVHADPEVARSNGFDRPILHGLCTLGIAARSAAELSGAHPADLRSLRARLAAPVYPGDAVATLARTDGEGTVFEARVGETTAVSGVAQYEAWT